MTKINLNIDMYRFLLLLSLLMSLIKANPFEGLTLISGKDANQNSFTHLVDNNNTIINIWEHDTDLASIAYLNSDSILFVPCRIPILDSTVRLPVGGRFKKMDWDGTIIWDYIVPEEICVPHHDIEVLPNGNILAICFEDRLQEETISKGKINNHDLMILDKIIEIEPQENNEANIVWEWKFWDRLIQEEFEDLENYMSLADNPGKLDINCNLPGNFVDQMLDWNHCNSIVYNNLLDQIMITSRRFNEIYIIDHSTTTLEAKTSSGGRYNKGGDFLYRWGNPQNYGYQGNYSEKKLFSPHNANWVPNGYPGSGNIIIFSNNHSESSSAVVEIVPPIDIQGDYLIDEAYGPFEFEWFHQSNFYSGYQSGAYRLPNGNTLITSTDQNLIFEISPSGSFQWSYSGDLEWSPRALKYYSNLTGYDTGDVNSDAVINVQDVVLIVGLVVSLDYNSAADLSSDGIVNVLDVVQLVNIILN